MEHLSDDILKDIRQLAGLFFSPAEIAVMLNLDEVELCKACRRPGTAAYLAYHAGKLEKEMIVRRSVIDLAGKGSSPAQTLVLKMIDQVNGKKNNR